MRDRLVVFSTVQLLLFGSVFAIAYWQFAHRILPTFQLGLHEKTAGAADVIGGQIDVALATDDADLAAAVVAKYVADPDFAFVSIVDARGGILLERGTTTSRAIAFDAPPRVPRQRHQAIETWVPVTLEGVKLGTVTLAFSSARIDTLGTWATRAAMIVACVWMLALVYSVWFARSFVSPLRAMMRFSHEVASGVLSERLEVDASDELRGLQADLNSMAADLERREAERRRRTEEVAEMQQALVTMSRTAGRAEVATNVLHNVGNVLNSLNVSVAMIGEHVRDSKVRSLARSMDLVDRCPGGLASFLESEKGKLLPQYLSALSTRLVEERTEVLAELASVQSNVEHIKAIVATQQSYAHGSGLSELVVIAGVIDDALRMGEMSFSRHGIEVFKDYVDDLSIETDRHKLLEILINVVSNARHALTEVPSAKRELHIRLRRSELGVAIAISDTGVGIPEVNLDRVFQHGFTTKPDGHGFGLHACANAAHELGGSITAASAGAGAEFTIHLPLRRPDRGNHDHSA